MSKISIHFFDDREVRAVWDEENSKWWFSMIDIDCRYSQRRARLYKSSQRLEVAENGTTKSLQQIHAYIFGRLYD
jgi:cell filamentation protein